MGKYKNMSERELNERPHLWRKGQSGNPLGNSREVAQRNQNNARKAAMIREKFLDTLESRIATIEAIAEREFNGHDSDEAMIAKQSRVLALLNSDVNRLMTDSENRGFGAPKQAVEVDDKREKRVEDYTDDELLAIAAGETEEAPKQITSEDEQG